MKALKRLRALNDHIIFSFLQDTTGGKFSETSRHGIVVVEDKDKQLNAARWARVIKIGKSVSTEIKPDMYVLIEALQWTTHLEFGGEKFWVTTEEKIMAVSDESPI